MSDSETRFVIFIDYDNLLPKQQTAGILDVVTKVLLQAPLHEDTARARCLVRVYGGWYEGPQITRKAQDITVEIQRDFPKIIYVPANAAGHVSISLNAELAVAMLQEPGHHLFNTYRRKLQPSNVRVQKPASVGCSDPECLLLFMKTLLKSGRCPKNGCSVSASDLVYRHEQKIVDTMLSCDLIYAAQNADHILLVSGDDDFLPPLRTVLLAGSSAVRFHTRPNSQRISLFQGGIQLQERYL